MNGGGPRTAGLLTRHGKHVALAPLLRDGLGVELRLVDGFDTDRLGTFAGDVPRAGSQREVARRKARIALDLADVDAGLGSEGSFGSDPVTGMLPWNRELLVWLERDGGLEVVGRAQGPAHSAGGRFGTWEAIERFVSSLDFPRHGLMLTAHVGGDLQVRKGIVAARQLQREAEALLAIADAGAVEVGVDLRAHMNPTRRAVIEAAARDLVERLSCHCPACGSRGFGVERAVPGLPCAWCGAPTASARADAFECPACGHHEQRARTGAAQADPGRCDRCNP